MYRIGIIGGGAAGMMAAAAAAEAAPDAQVVLLEKNEKLGKKLYITGKGRCNLTNICETAESFDQIPCNPKFVYSAVYGFDHDAVMSFFEESGVPLKTERGGRVFPVSDHASDITRALENRMRAAGVKIRLHAEVKKVLTEAADQKTGTGICRNGAAEGGAENSRRVRGPEIRNRDAGDPDVRHRVTGVMLSDGSFEQFDALIIATGGISYPLTGSTGDGYRFARESGHRIEDCRPSLVPFETRENWPGDLQGLSLRNVNVRLYADAGGRCLVSDGTKASSGGAQKADSRTSGSRLLRAEFGEMLFTHFGVSGPVILTLSAVPTQAQIDAGLHIEIDLKPALDPQQLDRRLLRDIEKYSHKDMINAMRDLLPQRLIPVVLTQSDIPAGRKADTLTKEQRLALGRTLKALTLHVKNLRGFGEAVITRGGVCVRDIAPSTMESKLVSGLYFAGEVIDVDGMTGGYNLQIAWSTGHLAGISAADAANAGL